MPAVAARWRPAPSSRAGTTSFDWNGGILRAIRDQNDFLNGFATQRSAPTAPGSTRIPTTWSWAPPSGASSFNKLGAGTLTLSGNSAAFTGNTAIRAGTLQVDGILGGPVNVLAGARLTGTGRVGATTNQGVIAPDAQRLRHADDRRRLCRPGRRPGSPHAAWRRQLADRQAGDHRRDRRRDAGHGEEHRRRGRGDPAGIQIVQVNGVSAGQFNLANGDYVIDGRPAPVAGAYGYCCNRIRPTEAGI